MPPALRVKKVFNDKAFSRHELRVHQQRLLYLKLSVGSASVYIAVISGMTRESLQRKIIAHTAPHAAPTQKRPRSVCVPSAFRPHAAVSNKGIFLFGCCSSGMHVPSKLPNEKAYKSRTFVTTTLIHGLAQQFSGTGLKRSVTEWAGKWRGTRWFADGHTRTFKVCVNCSIPPVWYETKKKTVLEEYWIISNPEIESVVGEYISSAFYYENRHGSQMFRAVSRGVDMLPLELKWLTLLMLTHRS